MKQKRMHCVICLFMAVIWLFSGMCFQTVSTHSSFAAFFQQKGEILESKEKKIIFFEGNIPEISEWNEEESFIDNRRDIHSKFVLDTFYPFCPQKSVLRNLINFYMTIWEYQNEPGSGNMVIISFIHYSDGKK